MLAAPWALDLGGPLRGPPSGGPSGGPSDGAGRQGGPPRVWDGFKDVCFEADCLLPPGSSNAEVYAQLVEGSVAAALSGCNAAVLAYGQTASGKTHTMFGGGAPQGPPRQCSSSKGGPQRGPPSQGPRREADKGVIEMALNDIFKERDRREATEEAFAVSLSMLEVYQETVVDLLQETLGGRGPGGPPAPGALPVDARPKRTIALCERADGQPPQQTLNPKP